MSLYRRISRHWSVIGVLLVTSVLLLLIFSVYIERGRSIEQIIGTKVADINREQRIKKQHPNFPLSGSDQIPKTSLKTILLWVNSLVFLFIALLFYRVILIDFKFSFRILGLTGILLSSSEQEGSPS